MLAGYVVTWLDLPHSNDTPPGWNSSDRPAYSP